MPKQAFYNLDETRREEILDVAAREFAERGYRAASTNHIVQDLGISKGSLFYYFSGKEDLYVYILDSAREEFMAAIAERARELPEDLIERLRAVTEIGLDLLISRPLRFRVYMRMTEDMTSEVHRRYLAELQAKAVPTMEKWFGDVDMSRFRTDSETTFRTIGWLYTGIKMEMRTRMSVETDPGRFKQEFMERVDLVLDAVRHAVYVEETE